MKVSKKSDEVVVLSNVILADLEEIEAVVADLVVLYGPDQSFELVNVEGLRAELIVIQWVDGLLLDKIEEAVTIEVHFFGAYPLHPVGEPLLAPTRHIFAVLLHALVFDHMPPEVPVKDQRAYVVENEETEKVGRDVRSLLVPADERLEQTVICYAHPHELDCSVAKSFGLKDAVNFVEASHLLAAVVHIFR